MTTRRKHVPVRTCIVCGKKSPKRELARIVARPGDGVHMDASGKAPGRGAYVCADGSCLRQAKGRPLRRGRVENALRVGIGEAEWEGLLSSLGSLGAEDGN